MLFLLSVPVSTVKFGSSTPRTTISDLRTCLGSAVPLIYWSITTETLHVDLSSHSPPNLQYKAVEVDYLNLLPVKIWHQIFRSTVELIPQFNRLLEIDPLVSFRVRRPWPEILILGHEAHYVPCIQSSQAYGRGASVSSTRAAL